MKFIGYAAMAIAAFSCSNLHAFFGPTCSKSVAQKGVKALKDGNPMSADAEKFGMCLIATQHPGAAKKGKELGEFFSELKTLEQDHNTQTLVKNYYTHRASKDSTLNAKADKYLK